MDRIHVQYFFLVSVFILFLGGCSHTDVLYSKTFDKPAQPSNEYRVLYLESYLTGEQSPANPFTVRPPSPDSVLTSVGYYELGNLLNERIPLIFNLNGLSAQFETVKLAGLNRNEAQKKIFGEQKDKKIIPLLVLQIVGGDSVTRSNYGVTSVALNLHANLYNATTKKRIWTGQFRNALSVTMFKGIAFNKKYVDNMLKQILDQMAQDKVINLPKGEANIPADEKNTPSTSSS